MHFVQQSAKGRGRTRPLVDFEYVSMLSTKFSLSILSQKLSSQWHSLIKSETNMISICESCLCNKVLQNRKRGEDWGVVTLLPCSRVKNCEDWIVAGQFHREKKQHPNSHPPGQFSSTFIFSLSFAFFGTLKNQAREVTSNPPWGLPPISPPYFEFPSGTFAYGITSLDRCSGTAHTGSFAEMRICRT